MRVRCGRPDSPAMFIYDPSHHMAGYRPADQKDPVLDAAPKSTEAGYIRV